ncbi:hypothetical protein [Natronobacterium texcoconense]|uniref:Uncharacterized protein n=1 Tax=Natronobacterium texcoconense TaxID=1095778 RepID=A0A1H1IP91_NATTX|nr:hypothetical protein [Natronobacterium texcoconense]SDR39551.1 hypothetical protein SAMN04489842_3689 [Natronobacterium texcoconense]
MPETSDSEIVTALHAIRTAIAALALAALAVGFLHGGNDVLGLWLFLGTVVLVVHSFVPTRLDSSE